MNDEDFIQLQCSAKKWSRYSIVNFISKGAFGDVYEIHDEKSNSTMAMKSIAIKSFESNEKPKSLNYICRELRILIHVRSRYLLQLIDAQITMKNGNITKIWLVVPFMEHDLYNILYTQKRYFSFDGIIKVAYQILKGLLYLHAAGIIHRDLKPSNIGINGDYRLRILDFGMSREQFSEMSMNVTTPNYRAIEAFFTAEYSTPVDIWSVGCILIEIFRRTVLFRGKTAFEQVSSIVRVTGISDDDYKIYPGLNDYRDKATVGNQLQKFLQDDILNFECSNDDNRNNPVDNARNVTNLICAMLALDPRERPTANDAMNSILFAQNNNLIKDFPDDVMPESFVYNCDQKSNKCVQDQIIEEINRYNQ